MSINREIFFASASAAPFSEHLAEDQMSGLQAILSHWETFPENLDERHLAYMLATVYHETGRRFMPVREGFASSDAEARKIVENRPYGKPDANGHVYYGRGFVQITWRDNYKRIGDLIGVDLADNPDLALNLDVATRILFQGMTRGLFTGKKLTDYFNSSRDDPVGARAIININDKAELIAGYHQAFLAAIHAAQAPDAQTAQSPFGIPQIWTGAATAASGLITAVLATLESPWALGALVVLAVGLAVFLHGHRASRQHEQAREPSSQAS